ncbi:MAG TPA: hypothetical protein ENN40_05340 [Candidatus Aminicenantes bacterium]|nr:hypothetical protein [Candidatus Aminicenantes bacterium]
MTKHTEVLIIGGGISGSTAAHFLRRPWQLLEREPVLGGLSTQYRSNDFWFDYGGHYFHFLHALPIQSHLTTSAPFKRYVRRSKVRIFDRLIPFPLQSHLESLPATWRHRIVRELATPGAAPGNSLGSGLRATFGSTLYQIFFYPFLSKYYDTDPDALASGMEKGSIPQPRPDTATLKRDKKPQGYNPEFFYPVGGLRLFWKKYEAPLMSSVRLSEPAISVDLTRRRVETRSNTYTFSRLINTIPLPQFLSLLNGFPANPNPPGALIHASTRVTNMVLAVRRRRFHWVYLPETIHPYYRMGYYPGAGACKIYLEQSVPLNTRMGEKESDASHLLQQLGVIHDREEILYVSQRTIPISYVLFNQSWFHTVPEILQRLKEKGVYSIGRYGSWNYSSMAEDALTARNTALAINREMS